MLSNISFQIPVGIAFLTLILWRMIEFYQNQKEQKENLKKIKKYESKEEIKIAPKIVLIIGILIAIALGIIFYKYSPMKSLEKIAGVNYLKSYTYNSFLVFDRNIQYEDSSCLASMISVFPIGLLIGVWYIFKEENKHLNFIMPTVVVSILELLLIVSNKVIPFIPNYLVVLGFNLLQIYMIIYMFARMEGLFNLTKSAYIALLGLVMIILMPVPSTLNVTILDLSYLIFVLEAYIVLNYSDRRFWRLASWVFTITCLFEFVGSIIVNFV
ncbi:MAG: hypothetical protein IJ629_05855 [Clostridia bacterium]|nr:hypothetical protein [Clostridia bacterium]